MVRCGGSVKALTTRLGRMRVLVMSGILLGSVDRQKAVHIYKEIEELQMKLVHSHSINLMRTREAIVKTLMELCEWREALAYCRLTVPAYERVHPCWDCSITLNTCGKLESFLRETYNAVRSLTKAADLLRITHGTKTQFVKELLFKLEEARAEACYKGAS